MDVVLDTGLLQVFHAGGSTGHHEDCAVCQVLVGCGSKLGIFVIRRAQHDDVCAGLQACIHTLFHGLETVVVDYLVTCASEEVAAELRTCQTHSQVADGQHKDLRLLAALLGAQT